jgi:transcriptional regulator with XRE-family HTH domain
MAASSDVLVPNLGSDARNSERVELLIETEGQFAAGVSAKVWVHNISSTGMLLESDISLDMGQNIQLMLPEAGATDASVVWASEPYYGCRFAKPLGSAALSAAKLRNLLPPEYIAREEIAMADEMVHGVADAGLSRRLRQLREDKGLSLAALSRQSGISKPSIWAWETGKTMPRPRSINALANALGVSPAYIWGRSSPSQPAAPAVDGRIDNSLLEQAVAEARRNIAAAAGISAHQVKISLEL